MRINYERPLVVITTDTRYLPYSLVCSYMASVFSDCELEIKIICIGTDQRGVTFAVNKSTIEFISLPRFDEFVTDLPEFERNFGHISKAMYVRLLLPQIIHNRHFCIYLDVDTMPLINLRELWQCRHENYAVQGVVRAHHEYIERLGFDKNSTYVNSGVLLINLEKWREEDLSAKTLAILRRRLSELFHPDQDAINLSCRDSLGSLPFEFNLNPINPEPNIPRELVLRLNRDMDGAIFHFYGPKKPWNKNFDYRWHYLYKTFQNQTIAFCPEELRWSFNGTFECGGCISISTG